MCDNENEDAFDNTVKDLILEIGASTSSFAELRNKGFRMKEIQELLEIGAINVENDLWLKDCVSKGDCVFLYFTAPLRLSEKEYLTDYLINATAYGTSITYRISSGTSQDRRLL